MPQASLNGIVSWKPNPITNPHLEQIVGDNNFQNPWFLDKGSKLSKSVGLIPNAGSAFLIAPDLLMTNWHIFRRIDWAKGKSVAFNVEQGEDGLPTKSETAKLLPNDFFYSNEELDFAVVRVDSSPGTKFGYINIADSADPHIDSRINIIQHPGAGFKKIAVRDNGLKFFDDEILQYWTDTEHGSSGSPLFDDHWRIVGLHNRHDSSPGANGSKIFYNQGYRINKIYDKLLSDNPGIL